MKFSSAKHFGCVLWEGEHSHSSVASRSIFFSAWLEAVVAALFDSLIRPSEPIIHYGQHGCEEVWRVYDPQTRQEAVFSNENEVRIWLEQRYYQ